MPPKKRVQRKIVYSDSESDFEPTKSKEEISSDSSEDELIDDEVNDEVVMEVDEDDEEEEEEETGAKGKKLDKKSTTKKEVEESSDVKMKEEMKKSVKEDNSKGRKVRSTRKIIFESESEESEDESEEDDDVSIPLPAVDDENNGEIERIICHKTNADGENEYMVKWKGKSYIHISWKKGKDFENDRFLKAKLQRYLNKNPVFYDECEDPFNSSFIEVDRIIASTKDKSNVWYLVKWQGSSYAEATWELEKDIKDDNKIKEFLDREKRAPVDQKEFKRPPVSSWKEHKESPAFKNGNQLRKYQLDGLNWLTFCWYNQRNSILADEMGLGKTVQTVSVVNHIFTTHNCRGPFLIVAPLSTIPHWKREFENWTTLNAIVYHGNSQSRDLIRKYEWKYDSKSSKTNLNSTIIKFNVLITTYEMIMTDSSILNKLNWVYLAIDEAHRLKNKNCKLIGVLKTFKFDHLLLLTGTPLQNNTQELWTLLNFMDKNSFSSLDKFLKEFGELKETSQVEKLHDILRPYLLRRMKEDVEKSIAPKEETIIEVELTGIQKKYYRAIYDKNFESLNTGAKSSNFPSLLNVMMQLRKCCNHPYLIKGVEENILKEEGKNSDSNLLMVKASGKLVLIDKLLPKLKNGGHKVLIFSQMVKMLDILEDYMHYKGYTYERIDGTKRASERQEAIDRFSAKGSDRFIFLLGTRAGGLGINLTAADTCIIYDSDWNPQNDLQAQARCHRIGQTQMVKIYRLITRNTYESIMFDKASKKLGLDKAVLTKMKGVNGSKSSDSETQLNIKDKKEIDLLLKLGAYALADSNEDKYDEEDIDKILERSSKILTTNDPNNNTPSTFSKASFVSKGAATNADLDVNDPDFWTKIMPERANKLNNPLIQDRPRTRKYIPRFNEEDDDDSSGSEVDEYEDEKEDDISIGWTYRERARLKCAILDYGYGQWKTIKRVAQLHWSPEEIRLYTDALLRKCIQYLGEDVDSTMEYFQTYFIPERSEPDPVSTSTDSPASSNPTPSDGNENIQPVIKVEDELTDNQKMVDNTDDDKSNNNNNDINTSKEESSSAPSVDNVKTENKEINAFDNDASLNDANFEDYKQRNAKLIVRRLEGIARVCKIILEFVDEFKDSFTLPEVRDGPTSWWTPDDDKSLVLGIFYHGYGKYDKMKVDPRLSFYSRFNKLLLSSSVGDPEQVCITEEQSIKKDNGEIANIMIKKEASSDHINEEVSTEKTDVVVGDNDMDTNDDKEKIKTEVNEDDNDNDVNGCEAAQEWPSDKLFNRRLRKLNRYLVTTQSTKEKQDKLKEKELEKQRIKDEKQKKREELWLEWSKREKLDFYRTIVTHGIPIVQDSDGESDWEFIKHKAKLTRKTVNNIKEYCEGLIAFSQNCINKTKENSKENNNNNDMKDDDSEKNNNNNNNDQNQDLTIAQCKRLLSRIHMFKEIREKILTLGELLPVLLKTASRPANLPLWWKPEIHDYHLILGLNKHGFGQWERICSDPTLSFYSLASNRLKLLKSEDDDDDNNNNDNNNNNNMEENTVNSMNVDNDDEMNIDDGEDDIQDDEIELKENNKSAEKSPNQKNESSKSQKKGGKKKENVVSPSTSASTSGVVGSYSNILDFPKDKVVLKRIETLIRFLANAKEKYDAKLNSAQQKKKKQTSIKDYGKSVKRRSSSSSSSSSVTSNQNNTENSSDQNNDSSSSLSSSTTTTKKVVKKKKSSKSSTSLNNNNADEENNDEKKETKAASSENKKSKKRARSPTPKKVTVKKLQDIPRNTDGSPIFPILIGKMRIESLGVIEYQNIAFHNDRYIWPVGYKSVRTYRSFTDPDSYCEYTSEIIDAGDHPEFKVTAHDSKTDPSIALSPTAAWSNILKKVSERMEEKNGKRAFNTVSGPEFFGLAHGAICKLIQELPNADKCTKYKMQEFLPVEPQGTSNPKKKRKLADSSREGEKEFTISNNSKNSRKENSNIRSKKNTKKQNAPILSDQIEEIEDSSSDEEKPKSSFGIISSTGSTISLINP